MFDLEKKSKTLNVRTPLLVLFLVVQAVAARPELAAFEPRGRQFVGFDSFKRFAETAGTTPDERVLTSPEVDGRITFTEIVVSWNAATPPGAYLVVEAQALYSNKATKFYTLGEWSTDPAQHPRRSVRNQKDAEADVDTDVLLLRRPADRLRVRLRLGGNASNGPRLKFLGISLADTNALLAPLPPDHDAWGKQLAVPERTQMIYPNGKTLCSPTSVSMLMGYWAEKLKRPELDRPVPQIAKAIYDAEWRGTGNWPFNMAYAGSFSGVRAYVARLSDVSELEKWVAHDIPVGLSLDYDRLRAKGPGPNGHLVVCVGFTEAGDPVINDPGTSEHVRKVFPRQNLVDAWGCSKNTVYLIYPESTATPNDRFGHWDSAATRFSSPGPDGPSMNR